jgi:hypothetical protein
MTSFYENWQAIRRAKKDRLVEAAPNMLAALKAVLPLAETYLQTVPGTHDAKTAHIVAQARAAIAKAEGKGD